ncbi:MAG TPA: recombinase family protein, partial [Candidatus Thermoplasmatota archaeon]|nr:recombinase family protein [Candidatus Thermoplasmatota archaeon]
MIARPRGRARARPHLHSPRRARRAHAVAVAYLRASSPGQVHLGSSTRDQATRARKHARASGYDLARLFEDTASGTRTDRLAFLDLLQLIEGGTVDVLLVWDAYRLGSNDLDAARLSMACVENGVRIEVVSTGGTFDMSKPDDKLHLRNQFSYADHRREVFLLTADRGKVEGVKRGYWVGGTPPIGYSLTGPRSRRTLRPTRQAALVREAFQRYARGESMAKVATWLNLRVRRRRYKRAPFSGVGVSYLLTNPVYLGYVVWNGRKYKGKHSGIVPRELFDLVQR